MAIEPISKFGRNADIDVGTEDCWSAGGVWAAPTTARVHAVVSSSANDTSAGTGARTIKVYGLDSAYAITSETVTMSGATPVNTSSSYTIIYRMEVLTAGSGGVNAGTITATAATDATVTAEIPIGENQTLMAIYQIPAGYTGLLKRYYAGTGGVTSASTMTARLKTKEFGGVFRTRHVADMVTTGQSFIDYKYDVPLRLPEKTIVKISGTAGSANMYLNGGFDIEFQQNLT